MTDTRAPERPTAPPAPRRRRHRLLVPLGSAVLLIVATLVLHAVDQPDPDERAFLSPVATGDDGGSRLAEALRAQGVPVRRETDVVAALRTARGAPSTLFVPAPDLVHPDTLADLAALPPGSRLVLVDPSRRVLVELRAPAEPTTRRWATRAVPPDRGDATCRLPEALRAGTAAVDHQRYAGPEGADRCYGDALLRIPSGTEVVLVGSSDPFRNDRIAEWGNEDLATGLLGGGRPLVWLDLPGPAPAPTRSRVPGERETGAPPTGSGPDRTERPDRADPPRRDNPLWAAFPQWFWAILVQLAVAGLLVVLWRARRLGPPVAEPLPVTVRSAETVRGRARLYRRAGARDTVAATLRRAALDRILPRLNLPPDTPDDEVAARIAAAAGADPGHVTDLLYGSEPGDDRELLALSRDLDTLARTLAPHPSEGEPR
ncbi:DUF4350 domain-containing protein [Micromonospora maritima]|uniref:DUF4350 domain-containing protein n=1 Tax=Micromonospora maritima TaxID=986711 RepID=A0ABW7ZL18_9ACTN